VKSGQVPIHIMRWAPSDFVNDPFVKLLVSREDFATFTLYNLVLNWSHIEGGDLPSDTEQLAAVVGMRPKSVEKSLKICVAAGKLVVEAGRVFHTRVIREVARELRFRKKQSKAGKKGGRPTTDKVAKGKPKATLSATQKGIESPPSPSPGASAVALRQAPEPERPQPAPGAAGRLRADINGLLAEYRHRDVALARASKTPNGQVILNLEGCGSVPWLTTTRDRLLEMRMARKAEQPEPIEDEQESPIAAWLAKDGRSPDQLAEIFLKWIAASGRQNEPEGMLREVWREEIGAPTGLGAVMSTAIYQAHKRRERAKQVSA
jgi:hypothetical protein